MDYGACLFHLLSEILVLVLSCLLVVCCSIYLLWRRWVIFLENISCKVINAWQTFPARLDPYVEPKSGSSSTISSLVSIEVHFNTCTSMDSITVITTIIRCMQPGRSRCVERYMTLICELLEEILASCNEPSREVSQLIFHDATYVPTSG